MYTLTRCLFVFFLLFFAGIPTGDAKPNAKVLTVGLDATLPPFEFTNAKGQIIGYSVDYIRTLAKQLGYKVKIVNLPLNSLFEALRAGNIQLISSSVAITPQREKEFSFTKPYFENYQVLLVGEKSKIRSFKDLSNKTVGVKKGTGAVEFLVQTNSKAQIRMYDTSEQVLEALKKDLIDAAICDEFVAYYYAEQSYLYADSVKATDKSSKPELFAFTINKDNIMLQNLLDKGIDKVRKSTKDLQMHEDWLK